MDGLKTYIERVHKQWGDTYGEGTNGEKTYTEKGHT